MYTKSIIQQAVESLRAKDNFRVAIEQLMEKYNIEDSVFVMKNGFLHEVVEGYFAVEGNYESLNEAVADCDMRTMGVRVLGGIFQTGKIHNRISECESGKKVFDLSRLEDVR
jgi:hypothetical protein